MVCFQRLARRFSSAPARRVGFALGGRRRGGSAGALIERRAARASLKGTGRNSAGAPNPALTRLSPDGARQSSAAHAIYCPPLALSVEPVMKPASSEARKTTQRAISSGWPSRRTGICGRIDFSSTSLGTAMTISVAI